MTPEQIWDKLVEGKAVRLIISDTANKPKSLYLIPSHAIELENRAGILICLDGRGSIFYDGSVPLRAGSLIPYGFMPLEASRTIKVITQILPLWRLKKLKDSKQENQYEQIRPTQERRAERTTDDNGTPDATPRTTNPARRKHKPSPIWAGNAPRSRKNRSGGKGKSR